MTILDEIHGVRTQMLMNGVRPESIKMSLKHYERFRDEMEVLSPFWSYPSEPTIAPTILGMKIKIVS